MTGTVTPADTRVRVLGRAVQYKWIVAAVAVSSLFLDVLDVTIVNVALPALGQELQSDAVEWVVLGYTLALAVSIPVAGWWSDRIGSKRAFLLSLFLFVSASALCGFATSMGQLIAFRVVQGIGGGMLTPIAMAMMFRAFPPAERVKASTAIMIPTLMAPALGPILGGLIVTHISWEWIFWVNVPIGIVAFVFGFTCLREHKEPTAGRFDLVGFVLSGAGLALSIYALSEGPRAGWGSTQVVTTGLVGALCLVAFVWHELRTPEPMLDLRLFHDRMFRSANIVMGLSMAAFLGLLFILPLYLQNLRGFTPLESGLTTFPQAIGVMIATIVANRLYSRVGPRRLAAFGLWGAAVAMAGFLLIDEDTGMWYVRALMFARGLTAGLSFMPLQAAAYATITPADTGRASSIFSTTRQIAISLGVATLATILANYTTLAGPPPDVDAALQGYHMAVLAAVGFAVAAGAAAFFLIKDRDAAATMRRH